MEDVGVGILRLHSIGYRLNAITFFWEIDDEDDGARCSLTS
jgi:hypothetical protein